MQKLILLGSSGHASVLIDAIQVEGKYAIVGFLDDTEPVGLTKKGFRVLGGFKNIAAVCMQHSCTAAMLAVGDNWWRRKVFQDVQNACPGLDFPPVKHPSAAIALTATIDRGAAILANACVAPGAHVGQFCIVNHGSSVDHDCVLHKFASVAPGVFMGGLVEIGECSHVGVGASISDRKKIGAHTVVGTGAVVVRDIPDNCVAYGNPARVRRARAEDEKYF